MVFVGLSSDHKYFTTTLSNFTCSASSNHKNIIHEVTKIILLNHEYFAPRKLPAIRYIRGVSVVLYRQFPNHFLL